MRLLLLLAFFLGLRFLTQSRYSRRFENCRIGRRDVGDTYLAVQGDHMRSSKYVQGLAVANVLHILAVNADQVVTSMNATISSHCTSWGN